MKDALKLRQLSFGVPAALITSMALIVGLDAVTARKFAVVGGLLISGLADNLTDSLSVHIYQESERLPERQAFRTTLANFTARLAVSLSFVLLFLMLPTSVAISFCLFWGFLLLSGLSYLLARERHQDAFSEVYKHAGVAVVVILVSKAIGLGIRSMTGSS
ncbi:MAG TPA: hypothetical protein VLZ74_07380 [Methylocella sp.]|nr:hypothetical protein [Methylocella sp.]